MKVIIIGGGIGGLAAAIGFARAGVEAAVFSILASLHQGDGGDGGWQAALSVIWRKTARRILLE
jgi:2-polyprenyl-6-methoxyphenol hydroxylase-like FAD-dependent oxidoreductase